MVRIGVIKTGNIASSLILELLLDERADRKDIEVRVAASGAKMSPEDCESIVERILEFKPELILYSTPNPSAPGPSKVIEKLKSKRAIVIGDAPGIKIKEVLEKAGLGYIFIRADSMIGARREFLDSTEMAIFNAEMLKILAVTGAFRVLQEEIDKTIDGIKTKKEYLPRIIVDSNTAVRRSGIKNPYAMVKGLAAYEIAEKVGELNIKGCFAVKEKEKYIPLVASAHEMLRTASMLADEIREIEKGSGEVLRTPHSPEGKILKKSRLMEKPK
ncbi:MAG: F420-dependent methylenetetrahydromethanopterin dehydrogenase [Candidatus Hydrothermarchaeota archaeon]|nr:F420-dependent methylenetetrahydromethanopterin dehydrogenase [Candidatus Hydrothermarchaeota archaeon]